MASSEDTETNLDTKVLAIASHVTYGYVGNTMATFVMQSLGYEVAAINTVHFSNHTGYGQWKGPKTPASEIKDLYDGLKDSHLTDFDMMLSGYIPSIEVLQAVKTIAQDLRRRSERQPGSFFWILDPVMGDQGQLYVNEDLVSGYSNLVKEADLVLPNQFEIEKLSGTKIRMEGEGAHLDDIAQAIRSLHKASGVRHIVVTSVCLVGKPDTLCVIGSSAKSTGESRIFLVEISKLKCYFSGTGDMFAGLMVARFREACYRAKVIDRAGWTSNDDVNAADLPLAHATCRVLDSMQIILEKTMEAMSKAETGLDVTGDIRDGRTQVDNQTTDPKQRHLALTKAAEVKVVKNVKHLQYPEPKHNAVPLAI